MQFAAVPFPPLIVLRSSVAVVWLYEGLWCKLMGRMRSEREMVQAVPLLGPRFGLPFLKTLGVVEVALAAWVMWGFAPGLCAIVETALVVALNVNGLLLGRRYINDPLGMIVKNISFLLLVWVCGAVPGIRL